MDWRLVARYFTVKSTDILQCKVKVGILHFHNILNSSFRIVGAVNSKNRPFFNFSVLTTHSDSFCTKLANNALQIISVDFMVE